MSAVGVLVLQTAQLQSALGEERAAHCVTRTALTAQAEEAARTTVKLQVRGRFRGHFLQ